jgi:hypothetical protein
MKWWWMSQGGSSALFYADAATARLMYRAISRAYGRPEVYVKQGERWLPYGTASF